MGMVVASYLLVNGNKGLAGMKPAKSVVAPVVAALLAAAPLALAAQQDVIFISGYPTEQDSVYQWGRWAVLSPAAGGAEPYQAASTPGAEFNARPGDASEFQPELAGLGIPTVPAPSIGDVDPNIPVVTQPPTVRTPPNVIDSPSVGNIDPSVPLVTQPPTVRTP
ncbi:MAG: hypothetical protein PVJ83_02925 [Gammaproteobacteria bacterium]|jgi:hypothetical protein